MKWGESFEPVTPAKITDYDRERNLAGIQVDHWIHFDLT